MNRYSASVIGGGAGGTLSMAALDASPRFHLVAMADLNPVVRERIRQRFPGIQTYASHEELFAAAPTDVVCVSTYPPSHETVTMAALALPLKGILVEKPLGHTAASGLRILNAIKARSLPMVTPHGLVVSETPLEIIARVQRGEIGELKVVEIQNTRWDIINAGIHWLNFFVRLTNNESMDYTIPESSLMALGICEAAYLSSRHRCKVTFPFSEFTPPAEPDWTPGEPYTGSGGGRDGRKLA